MIRLMFLILSFLSLISCDEQSKTVLDREDKKTLINYCIKKNSMYKNDTLQRIFKSLKINNFNIDTSFNLQSDAYLGDIISMKLDNKEMDIKSCECVDSVRIFKMTKINFDHKNKEEYFSYPAKDYMTETWINVWYFDSNKKSIKCFINNKIAFLNAYNTPIKSYVFSNNILSVSPASLKKTSLYKDIVSIIDSVIVSHRK